MAGVEALGITAAVLQLTQQVFVIVSTLGEIYGTVQDAPAKLRDGAEQLTRLVEITKGIEESKLFETDSVQAQLNAVVSRAKAIQNSITDLKAQSKGTAKRYLRVIAGNIKEKKLIGHFQQLEKEKTALMLAISSVHASLLNGASSKVDDMHQGFQQLNLLMKQLHIKRPKPNTPEVLGILDNHSDYERNIDSSSSSEVLQTSCPPAGSPSCGLTSPTSSVSSLGNFRHESQCFPSYRNVEAKDNALQLNGDLGGPATPSKISRNRYYSNIASGYSVQVNGNVSNLDFLTTLLVRRREPSQYIRP